MTRSIPFFKLAVLAALVSVSIPLASGASGAQVSLPGQTITVSGNVKQDSPTGPAYVSNPSGFYFTLTDGITTVSGQERRNNDPTGGPNKALQTIATFDGSQATISGTVTAASFDATQTNQGFGIGLAARSGLLNSSITYNSNLTTAFAGLAIDELNGHLMIGVGTNPLTASYVDLTNIGYANGPTLTKPVPFVITYGAGTVTATVAGNALGTKNVLFDITQAVLLAGGYSGNSSNVPATMTYSSVSVALPTTVGPATLLYAVSGDNQSGAAGTVLPVSLVAGVVDSHRNGVPGATVSFSALGGTVNPTSAQTDASGHASTQVTLGNTPGPVTVNASVSGLTPVTFNLTATANPSAPNITGVLNGASFLPQIEAGSWVTVQGANLSATKREWGASDFVNGALPTKLDGVSATINGKPAYIYYISPTQLNILAPDDDATGPVAVQVSNSAGVSPAFTANEVALSPGLFMFSSQYPAAVHSDGSYVGPPQLIAGATTTPAIPNEIILLFGTGFGPTNPVTPTGNVFSNAAPIAQTVTATVGGMAATVQGFLISPGLYQFNLTVPNVAAGDAALVLTIGGVSTPNGISLNIASQ